MTLLSRRRRRSRRAASYRTTRKCRMTRMVIMKNQRRRKTTSNTRVSATRTRTTHRLLSVLPSSLMPMSSARTRTVPSRIRCQASARQSKTDAAEVEQARTPTASRR